MHEPLPILGISPKPFLLVRRGLPLALMAASLLGAMLLPTARLLFLILALASLAEVWPTFRRGKDYLKTRHSTVRRDGLWTRAGRPVARLFGLEEAWVLSFCAWNNQRVWEVFQTNPARKALLLLPHCIQMAACKAPILEDLSKCHACGLCAVDDVLDNTLSKHWDVRISNRSHKAYRTAREFRPDLIVAVSCTDRLFKGLIKLPEVPSFTIPLILSHGMCVDTTFSVPQLLSAMEALVEPRQEQDTKVLPLRIEAGA